MTAQEANNRFKKLIQAYLRQLDLAAQNEATRQLQLQNNAALRGSWTPKEEDEFNRVLINYGVWDHSLNDKVNIKWTKFRERAPLLAKKTDNHLMENLYCVLARCAQVAKSTNSEIDHQRAGLVSRMSAEVCNLVMQRLTLMRKIHMHQMTKDVELRRMLIRMLPLTDMPKGWTYEHDGKLFSVVDAFGINQIQKTLAMINEFKNVSNCFEYLYSYFDFRLKFPLPSNYLSASMK